MWLPNELIKVAEAHKWKARPYTENDFDGYLKLAASEHGKEDDASNPLYLKWLYEQNPAGRVNMWLAEADNKVVGSYATVPVRIMVNGRDLIGSQSLNTLTHKDYRGKKIFVTLAELAYQKGFIDRNLSLVYGLPNRNSYHGFVKYLGFTDVGAMPMLVKIIRLGAMLETHSRFVPAGLFDRAGNCFFGKRVAWQKARCLKIEEVRSFDARFDRLWEDNKRLCKNAIIKDSRYLNWRYINNPTRKYAVFAATDAAGNLKGFVVCKTAFIDRMKAGLIGELFADNNDQQTAGFLVGKAEEYLCKQGSIILGTLLFKSHPFYDVFIRNRFIKYPVLPGSRLFPIIIRSLDKKQGFVSSSRRWHLTMGDFDVF